jgi:hypothetical protein
MVAWLACEQERLSAVLKRLTTLIHVQDMSEVLTATGVLMVVWCSVVNPQPGDGIHLLVHAHGTRTQRSALGRVTFSLSATKQ